MLLTIITPVYNTEKYLTECIESCLDQNISREDYEIIFIDDGSVDNSAEILDYFVNYNFNLRVVHKINGGVSLARNIALDMAQGDYIWFIDSDDFIERNILSDIKTILKSQKPDHVSMDMYYMESDEFTPHELELYSHGQLVAGKQLICSAIYSMKCISKCKTRFHAELTANGDLVFGYELRKSIGGYNSIARFKKIVYFYRKNTNSITYTNWSKKLNSATNLCEIMHRHSMDDGEGFGEYVAIKYIYFAYFGMSHLSYSERKHWLSAMKEKSIFPMMANKSGQKYYKEHYSSMKIKGVNCFLFKYMATPIGYGYVMCRSFISSNIAKIKRMFA